MSEYECANQFLDGAGFFFSLVNTLALLIQNHFDCIFKVFIFWKRAACPNGWHVRFNVMEGLLVLSVFTPFFFSLRKNFYHHFLVLVGSRS